MFETTFFRDVGPFEALRKFVLPEIIEMNKLTRRLRIWYGASSTGQEPYSVSMLIREHFPQLLSWDLQQLATDIQERAVELASVVGEDSQVQKLVGEPVGVTGSVRAGNPQKEQ